MLRRLPALAIVFSLLFAACSNPITRAVDDFGSEPDRPPATTAPAAEDTTGATPGTYEVVAETVQFTSGLTLDVFTPAADGDWPILVFVPGGAWWEVSRNSTKSLARAVASAGVAVYNAPYRLSSPDAFGDVACAVRFARDDALARGSVAPSVTLAGHSAGAHISAVVALAGEQFTGGNFADDCLAEGAFELPDGWVGIAGPYELDYYRLLPSLWDFFGGLRSQEPEAWDLGDPYRYLNRNPELRMALVHGVFDLLVSPLVSEGFESALRDAGRDVPLTLIPWTGHTGVLDPEDRGDETVEVILDVVTG